MNVIAAAKIDGFLLCWNAKMRHSWYVHKVQEIVGIICLIWEDQAL